MIFKRKKLKTFFLFVIFIILGTIAVFLIENRQKAKLNPPVLENHQESGYLMSMYKIRHIATREGKKQWILKAESASLTQSQKELVFKNFNVNFFTKDKLYLSGPGGTVNTETNDIIISGGVIGLKGDLRLETESLNYYSETRFLQAYHPVKIIGSYALLYSDTMAYDLDKSIASFKGNVEVILNEVPQL